MASEKQRRAAVPARAAATCGHGNMADPPIFLFSLIFLVRCCHLFHFKSLMQEHLILCDDKAVRSPETCCPEASWLEENPLRPSNWLKLVFTEVRGKFAMTSTEAKPAEVHTYLLCSVGSPQRLYPSYIHKHAAIRGTSDPHIAQSPVSFIFCFKKQTNKHNPQNIHIHLHLKTDKTRMSSVCTQHLWGNKYSLFPQNWPLKAGNGEKELRKANTAGSAASLQAKLSPARW